MAPTKHQTESREVDFHSKDVPWYHKEPEDFSAACRELLESYSHIPPGEVDSHVFNIREGAWSLMPYPCIGMFRFLALSICLQPSYPRVISLLKEPQSQHTLLDLGCCFAQDIRKLAHDGAPTENLYACDREQGFLDLGYDLFKDKSTMKAHFFTANAVGDDAALDKLQGKIDFVYVARFLHLFGWDDQLTICKRIIKTLKPRPGSLVFGLQLGNLRGHEVRNAAAMDETSPMIYRHSPESFARLWDVAGRETGTKWKTWGGLDEGEGMGAVHFAEEGSRRLRFEAERLE